MLLAFVVLLALSTLASTLALRQLLLARAGERVEQALVQEVDEFRRLVANGRNPLTGEPFGGDLEALFDVFLARNVPSREEAIFTFVEGRFARVDRPGPGPLRCWSASSGLGAATRTERGEVATPDGAIRYLAVPVAVARRAARRVRRRRRPRRRSGARCAEAVQTAAAVVARRAR